MEALRLRPHRLDLRSIAVVGLFTRAIDSLEEWRIRARERRQLSALSDAMLKDIGISRADASTEFEKPFWRS
ncbi:MAG TPA: DUF1127 domain-containing protein [Candidatus Udaeobacter sp.]|nr:DUF1127 domain-containing protein [Candidatus Udaeobacter sp.]